MRTFSSQAHAWLREYHGSIDSTALLMAYDAGRMDRTEGGFVPGDRVVCIDNRKSSELTQGAIYVIDSWPTNGLVRLSPDPSRGGGWEYAVDRFKYETPGNKPI